MSQSPAGATHPESAAGGGHVCGAVRGSPLSRPAASCQVAWGPQARGSRQCRGVHLAIQLLVQPPCLAGAAAAAGQAAPGVLLARLLVPLQAAAAYPAAAGAPALQQVLLLPPPKVTATSNTKASRQHEP
jgi:hypothetical protein